MTNVIIDNLPVLDTPYALSQEQIDSFREKGHAFTPGIVSSDEIDIYHNPLTEAVDRLDAEQQAMEQIVAGQSQGWKFVQNVWQRDDICRKFVLAKRFGQVAADLLGVDKVRIFRDQSYFKAPESGNTSWHQDAYFMPLDTKQIVTMWIALSDVTEKMAPLAFVTGSHKKGYLGTSTPSEEAYNKFENRMHDKGFSIDSYGAMNAGDASFHSGWTLHASRRNTDDKMREAFVIVYYADGAKVHLRELSLIPAPQEIYAAGIRKENLARCLPGLAEGDLAVTDVNPVVFDRQ